MKRIKKLFSEVMNNLPSEDIDWFIKNIAGKQPNSWADYCDKSMKYALLYASACGCRANKNIQEQMERICDNIILAASGDFATLQDLEHPSHKEHWNLNRKLAISFAKQKKCHMLKRGFVCYCKDK